MTVLLNDVTTTANEIAEAAQELAHWTEWGERASETTPGNRVVAAPGCLSPDVMARRGEELLALAFKLDRMTREALKQATHG